MAATVFLAGISIKPEIDNENVTRLVLDKYGRKVISITEINSYDDRNFLINCQPDAIDSNQNYTSGSCCVFKVTNAVDSAIRGLIEGVGDFAIYVSKSTKFQVPQPLKDLDGNYASRTKLSNGKIYAIRLFNFIPGTILKNITLDTDVLYMAGLSLAELTKAAQGFRNESLEKRTFLWRLANVNSIRQFKTSIDDENDWKLTELILGEFTETVLSRINSFRHAIIHGDFNENNILVDKNTAGKWQICGVIDFNDSHYGPIVFDLAILSCYMQVCCKSIDVMQVPGFIIAGFNSLFKIEQNEWKIIPISIMARLCQSIVIGTYTYKQDTSNEYVISSTSKAWPLIRQLYQERENLVEIWSKINDDLTAN